MKLYITEGSPYARMARVVVLERGLQDRVETVLARTRQTDSPYYRINPSGRVPYLVRDDGVGMEESQVICDYLDRLDGKPVLDPRAHGEETYWEARRLEALARSLVDGVSVWNREVRRPRSEQSPTIVEHERQRSLRMADVWEREIGHRWMQAGDLNMAQLTLGCALGLERSNPDFTWRPGRPQLVAWFERIAQRASFAATQPPVLARPA
jgi:glutathione S-transferase